MKYKYYFQLLCNHEDIPRLKEHLQINTTKEYPHGRCWYFFIKDMEAMEVMALKRFLLRIRIYSFCQRLPIKLSMKKLDKIIYTDKILPL